MTARVLYKKLGYKKWENFHSVVLKAIQIGAYNSEIVIKETRTPIITGSKAIRSVIDYSINNAGVELIKKLSSSQKVDNQNFMRNETFIISLLKKYYTSKKVTFEFQYIIGRYRFDCKIGNVLFEFDEPHHDSRRQKETDNNKNLFALQNNYQIVRAGVTDDIIDIIIKIDSGLI